MANETEAFVVTITTQNVKVYNGVHDGATLMLKPGGIAEVVGNGRIKSYSTNIGADEPATVTVTYYLKDMIVITQDDQPLPENA